LPAVVDGPLQQALTRSGIAIGEKVFDSFWLLLFKAKSAILLPMMKVDAIKRQAPYFRVGSNDGRVCLNAPPG
jgi:hypothetical protein